MTTIPLTLEFSGGMELLFQNRKSIQIQVPLPVAGVLRVRELLPFIRDEVKPERPELFMQEGTIRPGVLVLINENDWELEGGLDSELNPADTILFISTLHGGSKTGSSSSAFSSPVNFKRTKFRPNTNRSVNGPIQAISNAADLDLNEIYRNNRQCPEIERNLKQRRWRMASFRATLQAAEIIFTNWEETTTATSNTTNNQQQRARKQQFANYVVGFVMRVGPNVATLLHALLYTIQLRENFPCARGEQGCAHRLFVVSLLVSARYLNDRQVLIKPSHDTWSTLSGVFTAPELERMEIEFVTFLRGKLFIGHAAMERCVEEHFFDSVHQDEMALIVPGSVDWLELISVKSKSFDQSDAESLVP